MVFAFERKITFYFVFFTLILFFLFLIICLYYCYVVTILVVEKYLILSISLFQKGITPVQYIAGHLSIIHGLDWNPRNEHHLATSSQDHSVKVN